MADFHALSAWRLVFYKRRMPAPGLLRLDERIKICLDIHFGIKNLESFCLGSAQQPTVRGYQDYIIAS